MRTPRRHGAGGPDQGFTLIELLVVVIIIGILAAIAVPVLLSQRTRAADSAMKSDLRTVAHAVELHYTDTYTYLATSDPATDLGVRMSPGNVATVTLDPGARSGTYCVLVQRAGGATPGSQPAWAYVSDRGGIQAKGVVACA